MNILLALTLLAAPPAFHPAEDGGFPYVSIGGEKLPALAYASYLGEEEHFAEAAELGYRLFVIPAQLGNRGVNSRSGIGPFRPAIWKGPGDFDFTSLEADLKQLLQAAEKPPRVIVRLYLDAPAWYIEARPEAAAQLPDGGTLRQSFFSERWRKDTADAVRRCVRWLLDGPYAEHVAALHLSAGQTEEWFYHFGNAFVDENPARIEAFQEWLRARYENDAALQAAWRNPGATFEAAKPADISGANREDRWRDPQDAAHVLDTFRFHSENMVQNISYFAEVVKNESAGRLPVGAFYGYHLYIADPRLGHGALGKLLRDPNVDFLSSPNSYNRKLGEDWTPMAPADSVRLHGKVWLAENDTRTKDATLLYERAPEIAPEPDPYRGGVWLGPESAEDAVAMLRANLARMLTNGYGGWWFDMWGGWYSAPEYQAVLRRGLALAEETLQEDKPPMHAQVALLLDEELPFYDASFGALSRPIIENRLVMPRIGAPHDTYLRGDWERLPWEQYRFVWLLAPTPLTPEEEAHLRHWAKDGRILLLTTPHGTRCFEGGQWNDVSEAATPIAPETLRPLLDRAGVHRYLDADDLLYAGRGWIGIHTVEGGERTLRLPFPARVRDAFTGEIVGEGGRHILLQLPPRSTALLSVAQLPQ